MYGAYAATKAAQDSIAGALRAELADQGIFVTSVHPIGTQTEFFDVVRIGAGARVVRLNTPERFRQTPQRVARAVGALPADEPPVPGGLAARPDPLRRRAGHRLPPHRLPRHALLRRRLARIARGRAAARISSDEAYP